MPTLQEKYAKLDARLFDGVVYQKPVDADAVARVTVSFDKDVKDDDGNVMRDWSDTTARLNRLGDIMQGQDSFKAKFGNAPKSARTNGHRIAIHSGLILLERVLLDGQAK